MPPSSPKDTPFLFLELKLKTCWNPYWKHWFFRLYQALTENVLCVENGKMTKPMPLWTLNSRWFSNLPTVVCICVFPITGGGVVLSRIVGSCWHSFQERLSIHCSFVKGWLRNFKKSLQSKLVSTCGLQPFGVTVLPFLPSAPPQTKVNFALSTLYL